MSLEGGSGEDGDSIDQGVINDRLEGLVVLLDKVTVAELLPIALNFLGSLNDNFYSSDFTDEYVILRFNEMFPTAFDNLSTSPEVIELCRQICYKILLFLYRFKKVDILTQGLHNYDGSLLNTNIKNLQGSSDDELSSLLNVTRTDVFAQMTYHRAVFIVIKSRIVDIVEKIFEREFQSLVQAMIRKIV